MSKRSAAPSCRIPNRFLTVVTNRHACQERGLIETVRLAIEGGATMIQLREKDLPQADLVSLAVELRRVVEKPAIFIVNGNIEAAKASNADGIHLPSAGIPIREARAKVKSLVVGRSVHSIDEALRAAAQGADYLTIGTLYRTNSKPNQQPTGLNLLRNISERVDIPLLGIGGISRVNAAAVVRAGAASVAVISAVMNALDPRRAARALCEAINSPIRTSPSNETAS